MIYLDHNASTPVDPEVADEILSALRSHYGNPSSSHAVGSRAKALVEKARSRVSQLVGAKEGEIIFTSGGTESNNLAIIGLAARKSAKRHLITSVIEHPSVANPCRHLEEKGFDVTYLNIGSEGRVSVPDVEKAIREDTFLITIMHANNETGVLQPIEEIGALARKAGIVFHTDAAQTVGKIPVDVRKLNCDMMTVAAHKFYGPKGVGALFVRNGVELHPTLFGAGHERGLRPGTENVHSIAGLGKACELAALYVEERASRIRRLTETLYHGLRERIGGIRLNGHGTLRLPNTLNICIPGVDSTSLLEKMKDTLAASSGSACHAGQRKPSPVLTAMGLSEADALSSIRLSTGKDNTEEEMRAAVEILTEAALPAGSGQRL